jgi:L-cysteine:1D-myo-inositol 2-amino-2-deoxy-alpha-D-glucopyranoside ligase
VRAWPSPQLPQSAGSGPPLRLYDTATGQLAPTATGPTARMYVCGITPYDATHLGHAATYVAFDLVNRIWRDGGHQVEYVQNVTDIDDPLLERAVANGQDWRKLADEETETFRDDMAALRVVPPDHYIGAVESIPAIVADIQQLQQEDCVYLVDQDLYFDVSKQPRFGSVANLPHGQMMSLFAERGGDPDRPGKRNPLDPLLWQAARPDEPCWNTELGHGRPGWHIECTAIASEYLGQPFDVQGGGSDLAFPHHEMCAALGESSDEGWPFARRYVHSGMVGYQGHKMSKSLGNLVLVRDLRAAGADPMAIRLALLAHHYRSDWEWTAADLTRATERLQTWRAATALASGPDAAETVATIRSRLADDLATPDAVAAVDSWADLALSGRGSDTAAPRELARVVDALLGVTLD